MRRSGDGWTKARKGCDARAICFEGKQEVGNELTAVCWLHRGWQQAVVRSLAALEAQRKAAATDQLGAIAQGAASAILSRALGAIAQATASTIL